MAESKKNTLPAFSGSTLLVHPGDIASGVLPLAASGAWSHEVDARLCSTIGGDILADQACTLNIYFGQADQAGVIAWSDAESLSISASTLTPFSASDLFCSHVKIEVVNGGTQMDSLQIFVRGRG